MTNKNDISTPEGYFDQLQQRLQAIPSQPARPSVRQRVAPWLAYAASLAVLVTLGNFVLRKATAVPVAEEESDWAYISYLANALDPDGLEMEWTDNTGLQDEDIVNYLVEEGIPLEYLTVLHYEESY